MDDRDQTLDDILGQTAWIRGLARRLVTDAAERDDVVQQVWVETLRKGPRAHALRPWLFGVLRNVARTELRRDSHRRAREEASEPATAAPQPDELVERVELEHEVASALLEIAEPYRATLLLRYYEDLSPTEIARRLKIPAGTVRWRLKQGLELLRNDLDARFSGDRRRWVLALVPTAAAARGGLGKVAIATIGGMLIMKVSTKIVAAVVILLAFVAGGVALWRHASVPNEVSRARPGVAWRVPGGIGATSAAPPTVSGVAVPSWFGQRGAPLRRIAGVVTFAGAPVANATVELASELTDTGLLRPAKIRTGDDGRFDFGTQPPAMFSVAATAEGRSAAIAEVDTRDPRSAAERLELRLGGCESALFGHVSDSSGGPIAGAQVCLAPPRASACATADGSGAYKTCLTPRQDIVSVSASGYGAIYDRLDYVGHRLQHDFALTPEAVINGRVVRADTGAPIAQASIRVSSADAGQRFPAPGATTTNEAGHFTISGLASGRYRVRAFAEGLATTEAVEVNVEAGHASGEVLLRLSPASRVSGVVTDGRDAIVGATVSLGMGTPSGSIDAVTQSDGSFVLDPVGKGFATLTVRDYDVREPKTIKIDRNDVSGVRVLVDVMGSIAGRVTRQGKPAAGAQVFAAMQRDAAIAELDGSYVLRGLAPGRYQVSAGDHTNSAFGKGTELVLGKGERRTGIDFEITYEGAISGVVVEPDGKPVADVGINFGRTDYDDGGADVTAPDGTFRIRSLMGGGVYRAMVRAAARSSVLLKLVGDPPTVTLKDGASEVTGVRVVVQRDHLSISGSTVDGDGQPLSDVRVVAFRTDDPTGAMLDDHFDHPGAISAVDGSYLIENLDAATYVVRGRAGDGSEGVARGVSAGQKNVVVTLKRAGAIDGTLVGFSSQPAVQARTVGVNRTNVFATVDGNNFRFRGLSPGTYQVAAVGAEADAQSVDVSPGQTATVTLHSRGSTTIRGRVVDFESRTGVLGMSCSPGLRSTAGAPTWINSIVAFSDENGAFVLEGAPTGNISVGCSTNGSYWTNGKSDLTVNGSQEATCEVPVVKMDPERAFHNFDAAIEPGTTPARFSVVRPHGLADRAGVRGGDVILTVDGVSVAPLTPMGVSVLIGQRSPGTTVHLGLNRGGQTVTADLVMPAQ